jgi:hypothetical protein
MGETFKASVQYNDLLGSVAADRADSDDAHTWLEQNGHIQAGEFLLGIEAYVSIPGRSACSDVIVDASFMLVSNGVRLTFPMRGHDIFRSRDETCSNCADHRERGRWIAWPDSLASPFLAFRSIWSSRNGVRLTS